MALADTAVLFCGTLFDKRSPKAPRPDDQSAEVPGFLTVSDILQFVAFAFYPQGPLCIRQHPRHFSVHACKILIHGFARMLACLYSSLFIWRQEGIRRIVSWWCVRPWECLTKGAWSGVGSNCEALEEFLFCLEIRNLTIYGTHEKLFLVFEFCHYTSHDVIWWCHPVF
jgi:hypothetical protein